MRHFRLLFLTLFLSTCAVFAQNQVVAINFEGLTKTDSVFLLKYIETKVNMPYDSVQVQTDVQQLQNLNLFFAVHYTYQKDADDNYALTFVVEEAIYLYPIASISGFDDQLKIQLGANQINFLGRAQSIGFLYQYYDRHSFSFFYTAPIHSNAKTGHEFALGKYSTVEPLYFEDTTSSFNFDNYSVSAGAFYWLNRKIRFGLGGMYIYETYEQLDNADIGLGQSDFSFDKYQVRLTANFFNINQHFEMRKGLGVSLFSETIQTAGVPEASFFKFTSVVKYFQRIGKNGNFGIQQKFGVSTNNFSPFAPFVLDGFINVRGIGNRVARGTGEFIINTEYLHTVLRKKFFIAQLVALADYGTLRAPGMVNFFNSKQVNLFTGLGIRIHSQFFYKSIFRLDYAVNPIRPKERGFTFGLGQFF